MCRATKRLVRKQLHHNMKGLSLSNLLHKLRHLEVLENGLRPAKRTICCKPWQLTVFAAFSSSLMKLRSTIIFEEVSRHKFTYQFWFEPRCYEFSTSCANRRNVAWNMNSWQSVLQFAAVLVSISIGAQISAIWPCLHLLGYFSSLAFVFIRKVIYLRGNIIPTLLLGARPQAAERAP